MKQPLATLLAVAASAAVAVPAHAADVRAGDLMIRNASIRPTLTGSRTTSGYVVVINSGRAADRLVSASCGCASSVMIHHMWTDHGIMRMREAAGGLEIPAGRVLALSAGGDHLMFMNAKPLKIGQKVRVTLVFARAGKVAIDMPVRGQPGAMKMPGMTP